MKIKLLLLILLAISFTSRADDGYRLWLKYDAISNQNLRQEYVRYFNGINLQVTSTPIVETAIGELKVGLKGMLGIDKLNQNSKGFIIKTDTKLKKEGFSIQEKNGQLILSGGDDKGILYGIFDLLREIQQKHSLKNISKSESPKIAFRMLNHWDNMNGTIERGYAGASLWKWFELPETIEPRYTDYARANASIGINAVAVNNVNASARLLTKEYLVKVKVLADIFRKYGIKLFLSVNFASPKILGKLKTSDPLDPQVQAWWKAKTKEVYEYIPDFGGFLVKANSEGEPGPQEFGRSHADGANMLSEAILPHKGIVIWRAFVYSPNPNGDRFKEAYNEFKPLDGKFNQNVIVQVKNGPIDFQSREPFHPLFGAMPRTPLSLEFQITQEYLGFTTNVFYQSILYKECLDSDTYSQGKGSTVAKVIDGTLGTNPNLSMIAGVANTGSDRNWTGHLLSQANWYAFGRLAWNHELTSESIADEWVQMTFQTDEKSRKTIQSILLKSRDTYVKFTTPLGLHHIMGHNLHFGPEPWLAKSARPDWTSLYYHRADSVGLGFNRTQSGSQALSLYHPEVQKRWINPKNCELDYLLWFHHVAWNEKLSTGNTLWEELCFRYFSGVKEVEILQKEWQQCEGKINQTLFLDVKGRLAAQHREALNWRDACVLYFQTFSNQAIPASLEKPQRSLEEMKELVEIYQLK